MLMQILNRRLSLFIFLILPFGEVNAVYPDSQSALSACNAELRPIFGDPGVNCNHKNSLRQYYYHTDIRSNGEFTTGCVSGPPDCTKHAFYYKDPPGCPVGQYPNPLGGECIGKNDGQPEVCANTNPINIAVANKYQREDDYISGDVFPLKVSRTYNSTFGSWRFFPEISGQGNIRTVIRDDAKAFGYIDQNTDFWVGDPDIPGSLQKLDDGQGNIAGWRYLTHKDSVEEYDDEGRLVSVTNRAGINHTYVYNLNAITVTHSNGKTLVYQLNEWGRISGFISPDNEQYAYTYDSENRLIGITYPNNGGIRTYHYEDVNFPNALTGITDANGDRFSTWAYDSYGRAISSEHNNGADRVILDYTHLSDTNDPRTIATNALGKQTTYHFTTIHGVRKVTQVEGHQSANCVAANKAYTYDANGFLASKTDWKGNITRYVRNTKGQELSRTEAEGAPQERTITTEWHTTFNLPVKITEPERETVITYDANGNELSRVVTDTSGP